MSVVKDDRLQVRVDPAAKSVLESAARVSHLSLSAFVLQSAQTRAEDILAERLTIDLSVDAAAAFEIALAAPASVNTRLATALNRTDKFSWID